MGQLKHDGRATQGGVSAPAAQAIVKGDLYRINGWTGFALKTIGASDTLRTLDLEISSERIWYVKLPAALSPAIGDPLYWTAGAGFKRGDTDLQAAAAGAAVAKVEEVKDANGYCAVRALNIG
jgi:hypothetical protein